MESDGFYDSHGNRLVYCHARGKSYELRLDMNRLKDISLISYSFGKKPSMLPDKAAALARRELRTTFADAAAWRVDSVALRPVDDTRRHWYYEVVFTPPTPRSRFGHESFIIHVLSPDKIHAPRDVGIDEIEPIASPNGGPSATSGSSHGAKGPPPAS